MSAYSDYKHGYISKEEYDQECMRENRKDRAIMERMMYEDSCLNRCEDCEMWDHDNCCCEAGEDMFNCTIVG